jgi:Arc/MetJ family transcription regulator
MRTNIVLDDELIEEAFALTGAHTKKELVHLALEELVRSRKKKDLTELAGRIHLRDDYDHKALRELRGGSG